MLKLGLKNKNKIKLEQDLCCSFTLAFIIFLNGTKLGCIAHSKDQNASLETRH